MKTRINLYLLCILALCLLSCTNNKPRNNKIIQDKYFSVLILQVNQLHLLPVLDTIIQEWYQHGNDSDANKRCFEIYYGFNNPADTAFRLTQDAGRFVIMEAQPIDGLFDDWSIQYCDLGCVYYNKHLFFIHKCFRNTNWFSETNKIIKLKKYPNSHNAGLYCNRRRGWVVEYKNNNFFIPSYGGRWWGNPSDNNR